MARFIVYILRSRALTILLIMASVAAVAGLLTDTALQNRVDAELARLTAAGTRVQMASFNQPLLPSRDNAAPLYNAAMELCDDGPAVYNDETMEQALARHRAKLENVLADRTTVLTLVELAHRRPGCRYTFHAELGYHMPDPNYKRIRNLVVTLALQAQVEAEAGRVDAALQHEAQVLTFLLRFRQVDTLMSEMIQVACLEPALQPLDFLARQKVRADYRPVLDVLRGLQQDRASGLRRAVEAERALGVNFFDEAARKGVGAGMDPIDSENRRDLAAYRLGGRSLLLFDELHMLQYYRQVGAAVADDRPELLPNFESLPHVCLISRTLLPTFRRAWDQEKKMQGKLTATMGALEPLSMR